MLAKSKIGLILLGLLVFLPLQTVAADVGPKPTMDFEFVQAFSGSPVTIVSGTLFECEQSDCSDAQPLQQVGPQRFTCEATSCSALAYGFSQYQRLEIQFSDGITRRSNIFETSQFQSSYKVTINQDDLVVKPKLVLNLFTPLTYILLCGACLVGIAIIVVVIRLYRK
jgi:hypothetical protein